MALMKTRDIVLAYIGDGYLASAMTIEDYREGIEFTSEVKESDGYHIARADEVPIGIANDLLKQGCSDQHFSDGYDAASAAAPYVDPETATEPNWHETEEDDEAEDETECPACGSELDRDCQGELRCPECDEPCPHHYDGGMDNQ